MLVEAILLPHALAVMSGLAVGALLFTRWHIDYWFRWRLVICVPMLLGINALYALMVSGELYGWTYEHTWQQAVTGDIWVALVSAVVGLVLAVVVCIALLCKYSWHCVSDEVGL